MVLPDGDLDILHPVSVGEAMKIVHTTTTISTKTPHAPSLAVPIPPLLSSTKDGERYKRPAYVEAEICRMLSLPQSHWISEAEDLRSETLVFLTRWTHGIDDDVCGELLEMLRKRTNGRARRLCSDLDQVDREEVLLGVEMKILELILTTKPSRRGDFLEVAFAQAIKEITNDQLEKLANSPSGNIVDYVAGCEDEEDQEIERPIEFVPTEEPGPEDTLLNLDNRKSRHRLLRKALNAVADSRNREAVIRHIGKGQPITSKQRGVESLQRYFRKDPRQIKYWIDIALKQMRDALGVQVNGKLRSPRVRSYDREGLRLRPMRVRLDARRR